MDQQYPRAVRLTEAHEYKRVFAGSERVISSHLVLLYRQNELKSARLGLAVSKKKIKLAVQRHRIKRQIRESFRLNRNALKSVDMIILPRVGAAEANNIQLRKSLNTLWKKLAK